MKMLAFFALAALTSGVPKPPATPKHDVVTTMHGVVVHDPYRWLENPRNPAVSRWIDAQNAYADRVLSSFAGAKQITVRIAALSMTSVQRFGAQMAGGWLFYMQETPPQAQPVLVEQRWPNGKARVLVDPNRTGGGNTAIEEVWPSPSGRYVAYGTATGGSEATTIHVVDVRTGKIAADALRNAGGGTTAPVVAWSPDERSFIYGRLPAGSQFGIALYRHVLGAAQSADRLNFGAGLSPVAEYQLLTSPHAHEIAALVQFGDGTPSRVYLQSGSRWRKIFGPSAGVLSGAFAGDRLLLIAIGGSERGRIVAVSSSGASRTLVPEQPHEVMQAVSPIAGGFLVTELWGPDWRVVQYTSQGRFVRTLALPPRGIGIDGVASSAASPRAIVAYSGWTLPERWDLYDARSGALRTIFAVKAPSAAYARVRVRRLTAISRDGTRIPVTVIALPGIRRDGRAPAILTAYGGFDLPTAPHFIGPMLAWLQHGGIYAVANIRGGDEFGERWHQDGMLTHKQNDFDDFAAAARALIAARWTSRSKLGITGGSNGGLLMGAELTQHPQLYRAVVSFVGIYDMLRAQLWPNGRYNVTEYGSVANAAQFKALYAYSPYHHVQAGRTYPAVLLETGENDPRVAPWQSRKFAAALQATGSSRPVLLLTRRNEGHGIGASFAQRLGNTAAEMIFFENELR